MVSCEGHGRGDLVTEVFGLPALVETDTTAVVGEFNGWSTNELQLDRADLDLEVGP